MSAHLEVDLSDDDRLALDVSADLSTRAVWRKLVLVGTASSGLVALLRAAAGLLA